MRDYLQRTSIVMSVSQIVYFNLHTWIVFLRMIELCRDLKMHTNHLVFAASRFIKISVLVCDSEFAQTQ